MKRTSISDYKFIAGFSKGGISFLIAGKSMKELREAWESIRGNSSTLDESKVGVVAYLSYQDFKK